MKIKKKNVYILCIFISQAVLFDRTHSVQFLPKHCEVEGGEKKTEGSAVTQYSKLKLQYRHKHDVNSQYVYLQTVRHCVTPLQNYTHHEKKELHGSNVTRYKHEVVSPNLHHMHQINNYLITSSY